MFEDADVIYAYTRAQAIEDGVLVDVSEVAKEAGFRVPVALTHAVWVDVNTVPANQDVDGRLLDLLRMGWLAAKRNPNESTVFFDLLMRVGRKQKYNVKMVAGPGDGGEVVITIMEPDED